MLIMATRINNRAHYGINLLGNVIFVYLAIIAMATMSGPMVSQSYTTSTREGGGGEKGREIFFEIFKNLIICKSTCS